ncbi:MAG: polymer-forming cytoskeletal protein [Deltaproteobacteria bacterium]|nr:MAG: polymer-forming cytoskeletal protein [Deltaproteobacteria bacterium]
MSGKSLFLKGGAKPPSVPEDISAFLGRETSFEGKMTFQGMFRLEGKFEGEIFESGTLIVGESAVVKGKIGVQTIIINGLVEGEVCAKGRVEIHPAGKFYGNLLTPSLVINEGGVFEGYCKMEKLHGPEEDRPLISHREDSPPA